MIVIAENGYYRNKTSTIAKSAFEKTIVEINFSSMWSLWSLGLQKKSLLMAAFTITELRAIVITAIADDLYGRCNYLGLWTFLRVGSDSYSLYWLPHEMTPEKLAQKFHTDDATVAVHLIG